MYTDEMYAFYLERTNRHIALVQKYCDKIEAFCGPDYKGLSARGKVHDATKLEEPERTPYVWVTWKYRCRDLGVPFEAPEGTEEIMNSATTMHILCNRHHPEFHQNQTTALLNPSNRDGIPPVPISATAMGSLDLAEMVADWCAMSEERGNTPSAWADKVIGYRWMFTTAQVREIRGLISAIWAD